MADSQDRLGQQMGEYRLLRLLGKGAFGTVYLAEQVHDGSLAAVKLLQIQLTHPEDFKAFLNEARTIRLRHPSIVPLLDFGLSREDQPFLVMEYAAGGTLRDHHARGSRLPLPMMVSYVQQVASALQYAHTRRVIHRDVKPENMLVRVDGRLLLSDFGIATVAHSSHSINLQQGIGGTLPYMAPEQIQGKPRLASDQYALGVVVYEWIAGQRPFQGTAVEIAMQHVMKAPPSLLELVPTLPRDVEQVVLKALAKDPKERFASIEQFAQALQAALQPPQISVPQNAFVAPSSPSVAPTPTMPILASPSSTALPTDAGMPVKTASPSEQSQQNPHIPNTPLPQSGTAQPTSPSAQADPAETLMAPGIPNRSSLTVPTTSSTSASLAPRPPHVSLAGSISSPTKELKVSRRMVVTGGVAGLALVIGGIIVERSGSTNNHGASHPIQTLTSNQMTSPHPTLTPVPVGHTFVTYRGHTSWVISVAWSPDGKHIASGSSDKTVQVWNAATGGNVLTYRGHTASVNSVAWSPDGKRIASGSWEMAQVWDAATGGNVLTYRRDYGLIVAWSPDSKRIASDGGNSTVQVWDATTGGNVLTCGSPSLVQSVAWSPDGKHIASGSFDTGVAQVWDAAIGSNVLTYRGHTASVNSVAWSPDGKHIASGSADETVQVWNATTGGNALTYRGHTDRVVSVVWSPDGKRIASGCVDGIVQVWNAATGENVFTYRGHTDTVESVVWSSDGKRIASGSNDKTVQVWQAPL